MTFALVLNLLLLLALLGAPLFAVLLGAAALGLLLGAGLGTLAGIALGLGVLMFSGGLYGQSLTANAAWGSLAPVGGILMIVGWFLLAAGTCPCGSRTTTGSQ